MELNQLKEFFSPFDVLFKMDSHDDQGQAALLHFFKHSLRWRGVFGNEPGLMGRNFVFVQHVVIIKLHDGKIPLYIARKQVFERFGIAMKRPAKIADSAQLLLFQQIVENAVLFIDGLRLPQSG